ncbi:hypothetical protein D9758_002209 [Tetrapyrgos nigripes]|uniref:PEHE domain-containing protein n=1 Tax=Tetrapyrgos nigripes TaxID=182062 RepID=A0A8H5LSQ1_9AGAR|nr:hypothetical protein D9758_002209 [Tetrapyrgos nigripes]
MDISSSTSAIVEPIPSIPQIQPPARRVLPSRSRRAGPGAGVGNCDADQMILDAHKRKIEDVPVIPENTRFFLSTSAALAPPEASSSRIAINSRSDDRYFDRPDVIKAFRQQTNIETPEFIELKDTQEGLGRFRARDSDEGTLDTSDAAYERRHRKYETMEKRQRLRELEKLKHEQYKLKERIEQLRAMDPTAFLTLSASSFTPAPGHVPVAEDDPNASIPGGHANGTAAVHEGERRRKEMLEVATMLENRYRILLPPERHARKAVPGGSNPMQPSTLLLVPEGLEVPSSSRATSARPRKRPNVDDGESEVDEDEAMEQKPLKIRLNLSKTRKVPPAADPTEEPPPLDSDLPLTDSPMSSPAIAVLESAEGQAGSSKVTGNGRGRGRPRTDGQPPKKRAKVLQESQPDIPTDTASAGVAKEQSVPPIETLGESISAPVQRRPSKPTQPRNPPKKNQSCMLVIVAKRGASANARGGIRHNTAFGFKVSPDVDLELNYEPPLWLLMDDEFQKRAAKYYPNHGVLDPHFTVDPLLIDEARRASTEPGADGAAMTDFADDQKEATPVAQDALIKDASPITPETSTPNTDALPDPPEVLSSNNKDAPPWVPTKEVPPEPSRDHHMEDESLTPPTGEDDENEDGMRDSGVESEDELIFNRSRDSKSR